MHYNTINSLSINIIGYQSINPNKDVFLDNFHYKFTL